MLPFKQWGGWRPGAGRKARNGEAGMKHAPRAALAARYPVLVTAKVGRGLPSMRRSQAYAALRAAFAAGCERFGFRLVHYAVLNDHLHLLVEAQDRASLVRGLKGLLVRVARALNRVWGRAGRVFADRYHDRILKTPREVRFALRYVLGNGKKHERQGHGVRVEQAMDMFTSGPWFDGWRESVRVRGLEGLARPTARARTWLLDVGWRRHGLLSVFEAPAAG